MTGRNIAMVVGVVVLLAVVGGGAYYLGTAQQTQSSSGSSATVQDVTQAAAQQAQSQTTTAQQASKSGAAPNPSSAEGHGSKAVPIDLSQGLLTVEYAYQDDDPNQKGHFGATLLDSEGKYVGLLANEIGTTSGSKAVRVERDGSYVINVEASKGG